MYQCINVYAFCFTEVVIGDEGGCEDTSFDNPDGTVGGELSSCILSCVDMSKQRLLIQMFFN